MRSKALGVIFVCGVIIFIMPLILTQYSIVDFTQTGDIGDTIGGITAPFIGLLSAYLIYISFQEQLKANKLLMVSQKSDFFHKTIDALLGDLKKEVHEFKVVENLKYGISYKGTLVVGEEAIDLYCRQINWYMNKTDRFPNRKPTYNFIDEIEDEIRDANARRLGLLLVDFREALEYINNYNIENAEMKKHYSWQIFKLFQSRLHPYIHPLISTLESLNPSTELPDVKNIFEVIYYNYQKISELINKFILHDEII